MKNRSFKLSLVLLFLIGFAAPLSAISILSDDNNVCEKNDGYYISGTFKATDDDWTCVITLKYDGTYVMTESEGAEVDPPTYGTYTISGEVYKGGQETISLYRNGEYLGSGVIAWPLQENLCLILDGYVFYKIS